jgi:hexosaminidase
MPKPLNVRSWIARVLAAAAGIIAMAAPALGAPVASIIPAPASVAAGEGTFAVSDTTVVMSARNDPGAAAAAGYFTDLLARTRGLKLSTGARAASGGSIVFRRAGKAGAADGAYRLEITPRGATITSVTDAGLFYGAGSLWQLMTADGGKGPSTLQAMTIADAPRFSWRGFMLDSARHYQSPDYIRRLIDVMALHKLNVLHWHLTDDQAWRLQIRKYPRLTEVSAWRVPAGEAVNDIDPKTGRPRLYGGFYSQDEVREIVAYAAARHIQVVPEIEMPGHALAPIVAYPQLGVVEAPPAVIPDWGIFPYLYNVDETTFAWLEAVLDEVIELFPSRFIHIGGDEAVKDQWKASAKVQARMRELGIKDETALQGYFTGRIAKYLSAHGRRAIGWDEILDGGLPEGAAVMSWRGVDGAVAAAKAGHDAVLAPWPIMYFDNRQSDAPDEGPGRGRTVTLKDVYNFDPVPDAVAPAQARHILGLQANMWSEHIRGDARAAHMAWPREAAVAEIGWSQPAVRDWPGFVARLEPWMTRYAALGLPAADTAFAVRADPILDVTTSKAVVLMSTQTGVGQIRYTLDGSAPSARSAAYAAPVVVDLPAELRAVSMQGERALAAERRWTLDPLSLRRRASQQLASCSNKLVLSLEDDAPVRGDRAVFSIDVMAPCWRWDAADMDGVAAISVGVGQIPFNFQIGADRDKIALGKPSTPEGELEVRLNGCDGELIATLPLKPAVKNPAVTELSAPIKPVDGRHELCFVFTGEKIDPMWALDWVQLTPGPARAAR